MTWEETKAVAAEEMKNLRRRFTEPEIRLVLRAMTRLHHKTNPPMQTPTIIVSEPRPGQFQIDVSGRFGGGFRNFMTDREGVLGRLSLLKSYDCGDEPAAVIVPDSLRPVFEPVFPKSFQPGPVSADPPGNQKGTS